MVRAGVLAAVIGLTACAAKPAQVYTGPPTPAPKSSIIEVKLERKGCFGTCPAYTLDLRDNDLATYTGLAFAPRRGTYVAVVNFNSFARWLETQHVESFENGYALNTEDADSFALTVRSIHDRKVIDVRNSQEIPPELYGITLALDGMAARAHWRRAGASSLLAGAFVREDSASELATVTLAFDRNEKLRGAYQKRRIGPCAANGQNASGAQLSGNTTGLEADYYDASGRLASKEHWNAAGGVSGLTLRTPRGRERFTRVSFADQWRALTTFAERARAASVSAGCKSSAVRQHTVTGAAHKEFRIPAV